MIIYFKQIIKKTYNLFYKLLLLHKFIGGSHKNILFSKSNFIIMVIAFNNLEVLKMQHDNLKKFLKDPFDYVVADNGNKKEVSVAIKNFCKGNGISYVKIPRNPLTNIRASGSHGVALNWCQQNIIGKYKPRYFGFLDHDIFPLKDVSITQNLNLGFYGAVRTRKEPYWYIWPGFSFFTFEKVGGFSFNFFPHHAGRDGSIFLDTGGSNYYSIYRKIGRENICEAKTKLINLNTRKDFIKGEDSSQTFEIIDGSWLHLRQIAWREESSNKLNDQESVVSLAKEYLC